MSRTRFFGTVASFLASTSVVATAVAYGVVRYGERYQQDNKQPLPAIQKAQDWTNQFSKSDPINEHVSEIADVSSCIYLKILHSACKISGTKIPEIIANVLSDKMPLDNLLQDLGNEKDLRNINFSGHGEHFDKKNQAYNLAHIAAMSNRNIDEKIYLINYLEKKGVDINAPGVAGESIGDICPQIYISPPITTVGRPTVQHVDPYMARLGNQRGDI